MTLSLTVSVLHILGFVAFVLGVLAFLAAHRMLRRARFFFDATSREHVLVAHARRQITDALDMQTKMFAKLVDERSADDQPKVIDRTRSLQ